MRKFLFLASIVVFLFLLIRIPAVMAQDVGSYFSVAVEQDGKPVPIIDHEVTLKKKPFTILFAFPKINDINIMVSVSEKSDSFDAAKSGKPVKEIKGFEEFFGMAEGLFNESRTLMLSETAYHYWYYLKDSDHRFDEIYYRDGKWVCKRISANLMDRDTTRNYKDIENFPGDALYFVFLKGDYTDNYSLISEKQRDFLKIVFKK